MNKENKELQMKLDAATKSLQAEQNEAKAQAKASRETIERAGKERTELKRELDTVKEDFRMASKELEKTRAELKKLQEQKVANDPIEMQKRKESEMQVYTEKIMKLESELRKEQAKSEELTRQIQRFDSEVARLTGLHLEKYNQLDRELVEKRETVSLLEEQNSEMKRTNLLTEQRMEELRRKSREQFQSLLEQLEQAKTRMEEAVKAEQAAKAEVNAFSSSLKRQNSSSSQAPLPQASPPPQPSAQPSAQSSRSDFKLLEEEKLKAESKRREAMDDLTKAKRDYNSAKREAIQLAESVDRLRTGLNKAALQAGGNLALAADRCDDALRQCVMQIEAAVAAVQARDLAKSGAPSQSAGLADEEGRVRQHRQSSMEDPGSPVQKKEQEPEERLVNALNEAEKRLDDMTASLRQLLPKVKHVVTIAVQDKKNPNVLASICNLSTLFAKLFQRSEKPTQDGHIGGYQGLQRPGMRGGRRILPETPGQESTFDLEEESVGGFS
jgi:predicted  nucleic acid-binding Zn-ribbon protein